MFQQYYQRFLTANPNVQHFACHSHHYWPDVTREAMLEYWDDTAELVDDKWQRILGEKMPQCQSLIADALHIQAPERIVFAPNTHELLYRIYSIFDQTKKIKILTTDSEFYSFQRQSERWQQDDLVDIVRIPTEPFSTFEQRFTEQANKDEYDWIFCSQVFFNSSLAISDLKQFIDGLPQSPIITIDGYHGFFAIPTDLSELEHKIFYLAGSYKYAQGGEGSCFAVIPDGNFQPSYTGWFAEFGDLHQRVPGKVGYAKNGQQFAGATTDLSAMYRLHASLTLFKKNGITVDTIHNHVLKCQRAFLAIIDDLQHPDINRSNLIQNSLFDAIESSNDTPINRVNQHGHFLTFRLPEDKVQQLASYLSEHGIKTDFRGDRLRFGFALYHQPEQYDLSCLR
ncbi:aminotransferase class V-fold PLP-dependent enzyme [Psychrosphaera sp. B3R10]|uniref:aminotransferase class V-fold PLP-dependent enzyme n=1 Tax=unclassified Psychrosphaera TaxID=2641570 RepID=UPI001C09F1D1|nr:MULTISPECIES: aminotransferase class V-fold PLP-dependent enzyme [unclassified Psychrosphaera]MBU2883764.1 aminotransferase class V-fold PLP-dependent enzyme [Psychrosphaera sp. I2R16]MBU2987934.1 aminotransferase class V-fold PLP-dependent enzyme [Psychrosphaera sp. B3R10]